MMKEKGRSCLFSPCSEPLRVRNPWSEPWWTGRSPHNYSS